MISSDFESFFNHFPNINKNFVGVYSADKMPKSLKINHFFILNTDISSNPGKHWLSVIRTEKKLVEIFDSLGTKIDFINNFFHFRSATKIIYNESIFQESDSSTCGLFCVYFIINRLYNLDLHFDELLSEIFDVVNKSTNEMKVVEFCQDFSHS